MIPLALFIHTHDITISSILIGALAAGAGTFAFAADIAFAIVARQKVHSLTGGEFRVNFGPAVWIVSFSMHLLGVCVDHCLAVAICGILIRMGCPHASHR